MYIEIWHTYLRTAMSDNIQQNTTGDEYINWPIKYTE